MDQLYMSTPLVSGNQQAEKPRLISPGFGDGYKQSSKDGLNAVAIVSSYSWRLTHTQTATALTFLRAHAGKTFLWQRPSESFARKWQTPEGWTVVEGTTRDMLTINFEERFDLT